MVRNATASSRSAFGEEHQPSVTRVKLSSDGEPCAVKPDSRRPNQENNVAVFIKDVKRLPTTIVAQLSRRVDAGGLVQQEEMFTYSDLMENGVL